MNSIARCLVLVLVVAGLGTGPGCGGGGVGVAPPTAVAPTPTPVSLGYLDGVWRGMTAQRLPITIAVRDGHVVSLEVEWEGTGGGGACRQFSNHFMNVVIFTGGSDPPRFDHVQADLTNFRGTFASGSAASGSFRETLTNPVPCATGTVDWTASK